jgi:hypothetical protein
LAHSKHLFASKSPHQSSLGPFSFLVSPNPPHFGQHLRFGFIINPLPSHNGQNSIPYFSGSKVLFKLSFLRFSKSCLMNCGVHAFEPLSPRKAQRGGTVRHCLSIKGHNHVDRMGEADTSPCFLSRGFARLLRCLLFCLFFLFLYHLFPTLVLILLAFVSHCVPPFSVVPHLLAARVPLHRGISANYFKKLSLYFGCPFLSGMGILITKVVSLNASSFCTFMSPL